ncbi:malectin domain-containing carbohydrate-binding protein [Pollutibacter soli]|uniref:malectin domain-containing carbohydrate-binding protein n=1 Tax=Pollutibacter soli TaxID=3034157 RepID=UPI00301389BE
MSVVSMAQSGPRQEQVAIAKSWSQVVNNSDVLPESRHESGFVEFGGKFYLIGGRGKRALNIFNPETKTWTTGAPVPGNKELHHFQAVVFQNKIYIIGAFTHWFPEEKPVGDIYIYDPLINRWSVKVNAIPVDRRRGAAGAVVHNNLIYLVGGIRNGHTDGWVNWTDSYNPITGEWLRLADAPHERDHFQAAVLNNKLYAAAGRKTGFTSLLGDTESSVDEYNFETNTWRTLPPASDIPTPRAGNAGVVIDNKLLVAGGESNANGAHPDVELFDPVIGSWTELPSMLTGRHGTQALLYKGTVYIASGWGYITETYADELQTQESLSIVDETATSAPSLIRPLPNISVISDVAEKILDLTGYFKDDNTITGLAYTVTRISNTAIVTSTFISGDTLRIKLQPSKTGNSSIKIRATDVDGFSVEDEFVITVVPPLPTAPKVDEALSDRKVPVNSGVLDIDLSDVFIDDMPFDSLELSIHNISDSSVITKAAIIGNELRINMPANKLGNTNITIRAMDKDSLYVDDIVNVEIISKTQTVPTVKTPLTDIKQKVNYPGKVINLNNIFDDDQHELNYDVVKNTDSILVTTIIENDSLSLIITPDLTGLAQITVRATDADGQFAEESFNVMIYLPDSVPVVAVRINSGGPGIVKNGIQWSADKYFTGGEKYAEPLPIGGTQFPELYQSERYGDFMYAIPVPNGNYNVKLHFAEIYWKEKGERVFNVNIGGMKDTLKNFDIIASAGGSQKSVIAGFDSIEVKNDTLKIDFSGVYDNAKISAIEISSPELMKINNPPYVSLAIPDQEMNFGEAEKLINIYKVFYDDDGIARLKLSVDYISDSTMISSAIITGVTLNLDVVKSKSGKVRIRLKATDDGGLSATEEFTLTINEPTPEPPVVHIPLKDITAAVNATVPAISLDSAFKDNRGFAQLNLRVKRNSNAAIVTSAVIKNGKLSLVLGRNRTGRSVITISATDVDGLFAEDEFVVTVTPPDTVINTHIRINTGGETEILDENIWEADQYFSGGTSYSHTESIRRGENNVDGTERFGDFSYSIPVPRGSYTLKLYFKELYWTSVGQRVFNIDVESRQIRVANFDIVKKAGGAGKLFVQEFKDVNVIDSALDISFASITDNAQVAAIEIITNPIILARKIPVDTSVLRIPAVGSFIIYPNPVTTSTITMMLPEGYKGGRLELTIYNTNGSLVYRIPQLTTAARQATVTLPVGISKGTYLVKLREGTEVFISRIIVQ